MIQINGKTRFSLMDIILALVTIVSTQPSHSLVLRSGQIDNLFRP